MSAPDLSLLYGDNPLASVWLAASLEKKLTKQQYLKTSIVNSTRAIEASNSFESVLLKPGDSESQLRFETQVENNEVKPESTKTTDVMPLRISSQLLYGVVKIYSRKTRYLYEEVSLALIQLRSAFAVSKSITLPIEETVLSSLENITLKDTITEANILYDNDNFNLNSIFGIPQSITNTQRWANSDTMMEEDGDISIGRNNMHNETTINHSVGIDDNVVDYDDSVDYANQSIDALARRALPQVDDLDGAPDFDLPLDLGTKPDEPSELNINNDDLNLDISADNDRNNDAIAGISDFQISAIDNMDLEFTIDETNNEDAAAANNTVFEVNDIDMGQENRDEEEEQRASRVRKPRNKSNRSKRLDVLNTDVIRTQRRLLVIDQTNEIPSIELKKRQTEYPTSLREVSTDIFDKFKENAYEKVMSSLEPSFLQLVGSSWKSIKRRRLLNQNSYQIEGSTVLVEEGELQTDNMPPELPAIEDNYQQEDILNDLDQQLPEFDNTIPEIAQAEEEEPAATGVEEEEEEEEEEELHELDNNGENNIEVHKENDFDGEYESMNAQNKATVEVAEELRTIFKHDHDKKLKFTEVLDTCKLSENPKSNATRAFFELLVLGTSKNVTLKQDRLFGEIVIESNNSLFENFL